MTEVEHTDDTQANNMGNGYSLVQEGTQSIEQMRGSSDSPLKARGLEEGTNESRKPESNNVIVSLSLWDMKL